MSAIASPRLGIGPLIRVNTSVSSVLFSSRKRSCWLAGWCGLQMALKPWPFHVPKQACQGPEWIGSHRERLDRLRRLCLRRGEPREREVRVRLRTCRHDDSLQDQ